MTLCPPSRVARYRAFRTPRCNGGTGCTRCWERWEHVCKYGLRVVAP